MCNKLIRPFLSLETKAIVKTIRQIKELPLEKDLPTTHEGIKYLSEQIAERKKLLRNCYLELAHRN